LGRRRNPNARFATSRALQVRDHHADPGIRPLSSPRQKGPRTPEEGALSRKNLVLAAMVFAVAMTFIDQTIVAIAIPNVEKELGLSATESQWVINAYLLTLSALFAFGGKLADVVG